MNAFIIIYLPAFIMAYLLISFVVPSIRVYKQTGINPVTFGNSDNAHDYIGGVMKLITGILVLTVFFHSLFPGLYNWLVPIPYLQNSIVQVAGLILAHLALFWIVLAQQQMKNSWRIGIDEKNKTGLVTHGLFAYSRNPVFLGMLFSVLGLFLVLPNLLTFFVAGSSYIIIQIQIRLEEVFLQKQHGDAYALYRATVRRLL
jgi:protein-S-isoprenylcysteine O-methyltransferase Ste14